MTNIIVGTAGHIDHGKTALVRALTGIDTDRLEEEKRRGISIDIGFAHLDLGGGLRIGFVDVPGHERFIKNMLAGVGGIDLLLLVIAADESIKPQTREHFDICRLLGIPRGIIAVTKSDLVDAEILDLVRLEAEEFAAGSFLEGAPIVPVSATTGAGLEELKARMREMAAQVTAKDASRHFRLPVDRVFSMHGFGTVVTGTLVSGSVAREAEVEVHPGGRRLRVRGIQVHNKPADRALAGQRTALNITGAEPADLVRGMVLTGPDRFRPVDRIDCLIEMLPSAKPLKHRAPVHFHTGTAEEEAEVRLLDGAGALAPGARGFARIVLREPLLVLPGDRFIIRMFSPVVTIGGGVVADTTGHRYRHGANAAERLQILLSGSAEERVALLVRESEHGLSVAELVACTGLLTAEVEKAAGSESLLYFPAPHHWVASRDWSRTVTAQIRELLKAFHQQNPLLPGMPKEEIRSRLLPDAPPFLIDALVSKTSGIAAAVDVLRLVSHRVVLKQDEEQALSSMERAFQDAGLAVPSIAEVLGKSGVEPARARSLLQMLLRDRRLIRISEELVFHPAAIEDLRHRLSVYRGKKFAVPQFKDLTGISRKYAIPLLEYLDRERVTRREGDERVVL